MFVRVNIVGVLPAVIIVMPLRLRERSFKTTNIKLASGTVRRHLGITTMDTVYMVLSYNLYETLRRNGMALYNIIFIFPGVDFGVDGLV